MGVLCFLKNIKPVKIKPILHNDKKLMYDFNCTDIEDDSRSSR